MISSSNVAVYLLVFRQRNLIQCFNAGRLDSEPASGPPHGEVKLPAMVMHSGRRSSNPKTFCAGSGTHGSRAVCRVP
jgi:hypothetical protein